MLQSAPQRPPTPSGWCRAAPAAGFPQPSPSLARSPPKMDNGATPIPEVPVSGKVAMAPIEWAAMAQQRLTEVKDLVS